MHVTGPAALPRIGVTTYRDQARWGQWDLPADLLPADYADAVVGAGGLPLLLPPVPAELAAGAVATLDGLVVAGGPDVDPQRYGADRHPRTGPAFPGRDEWELALVRAALARDLPVLGVCRGLQVLNTALGGTLVQHLPELVGSDLHSPSPGAFGRHRIGLDASCRLAGIVGPHIDVATHHHQAVDALGTGLVACGWSDDGVVEAVELPERRWVVGVQWHPEAHDGDALFAAFVAACGGTVR